MITRQLSVFYHWGMITRVTVGEVVNQKHLKRYWNIVSQMPKVQMLVEIFPWEKRCSASHCTGHKERTALQRQDLGGLDNFLLESLFKFFKIPAKAMSLSLK